MSEKQHVPHPVQYIGLAVLALAGVLLFISTSKDISNVSVIREMLGDEMGQVFAPLIGLQEAQQCRAYFYISLVIYGLVSVVRIAYHKDKLGWMGFLPYIGIAAAGLLGVHFAAGGLGLGAFGFVLVSQFAICALGLMAVPVTEEAADPPAAQ